MKHSLRTTIFTCCMLLCGITSAHALSSTDRHAFNSDKMSHISSGIVIMSEFYDCDHLSCYQENGTLLWNVQFKTKILSFGLREANGYIYVFTKARYSETTQLLCIDPVTGYIIWEKP